MHRAIVVLGLCLAGCVIEIGSESGARRVDEPLERGVWWDNTNPDLVTCVQTDGRAGRYYFARKGVGIELDRELRETRWGASNPCKSYECPDRGYQGTIAPGMGDEAESPIYFYRPAQRDHRVLRVIAHVHPSLTFFSRFSLEPNRTGTCPDLIREWLGPRAASPEPEPDPAPSCPDGACAAEEEGMCAADGTEWMCEGGCWWWVPDWCASPNPSCDPCGSDQEGLCDGSGWICEGGCWTWSPDWCNG